MKFGVRKPGIERSLAARTSVKRMVRQQLGLKAPRGLGWISNPKRAAYDDGRFWEFLKKLLNLK